MTEPRILLWYRNDLRVHDHAPLQAALQTGAEILPIYCVDPRHFGQTPFGFPKTGAFRAQFLMDSLADLRRSLRSLQSDLILRQGQPEEVIPRLVEELGISALYYHREVTAEEVRVETALQTALAPLGITVQGFWGHTLYHPDDLPFALSDLPDLFTPFRKAVERQSPVMAAVPAPTDRLSSSNAVEPGEMPSLSQLGLPNPPLDPRGVLAFKGGETEAIARLQHYFWQHDGLRTYKQTRNGMLGANYSSKFSPWLALGCLSPRYIYQQVQQYEAQRDRNDSTYWLVFELLWRDYFRFIAAKHGDRLFHPTGLQGLSIPWKQDWDWFEIWRNGLTGYPLVDAAMRELAATGYMSNRGRQNVASFLTKNLGLDWRMGAEWFESQLIDYDVCSNWGNWNYLAGVGNDGRGFRYFNITKQARDYDPAGNYVRHWLPELARVPANKIHTPWALHPSEQHQAGVRLGVDYPAPVVDLFQSADANQRLYDAARRRSH